MPRIVTDEDITRHEGLIRYIAGQLALNRDMIEDLRQEGRLEAFQALGNFNPQRGCLESTYVGARVKGAMLKYLRDKAHMIRHPGWLHEQQVYPQVVKSLDTLLDRERSAEQHQQRTNLEPADPSVDVEAAALAQEELERAITRAHLAPHQEQALIKQVFMAGGNRELICPNANAARRKLRQAVAA